MSSKIYKQLFTSKILLVVLFFIASVGIKGQQDDGSKMYYYGVGETKANQAQAKQNAINAGYNVITPIVEEIDYTKAISPIDSEFSFYPKISKDLYYTGKVHKDPLLGASYEVTIGKNVVSTTQYYMYPGDYYTAHNVGRYNGQEVDMKVTFENLWFNNKSYNGGSTDSNLNLPENNKRFYYLKEVYFVNSSSSPNDKKKFLQIYGNGSSGATDKVSGLRIAMKYEFFYAGTTTPINVKGFWNLFRINNIKSVSVENPQASYILKTDETQLYYKKSPVIANNIYVTGTTYPAPTPGYEEGGIGPSTNYTYTFAGTGFNRLIQSTLRDHLTKYDTRSLTKIQIGRPSVTGSETTFPNTYFTVHQDIPPMVDVENAPSKLLYSRYELTIQVPPFMDMSTMSITVKDIQNSDANRLALFDVTPPTATSPKFVLKAKKVNGTLPTELYENSLEINITGQVDKSKRDQFKNYIQGNYIVYPITKSQITALADDVPMQSSNDATLKIKYEDTGVRGTAIPQIVPINTSLATLKAGFKNYVEDLNGGLTNNTLTLANSSAEDTALEAKLKEVGFAGFVKVKIKQNSSGEETTVSVPVSVYDRPYVLDGTAILLANDTFNDYVSGVTTNRTSYVVGKTNAIAWNITNGTSLTSKIVVTSDKSFMTLNPMVAGLYTFTLKVSDTAGNPTKSGIKGTITNPPVTEATGTPIPAIVKVNTSVATLKANVGNYVENLNGGLNNNTLTPTVSSALEANLKKVGFAGKMSVKITQKTSGKTKTVQVPVSVVSDYPVKANDMILDNIKNFEDYVSGVPNGVDARETYVVKKTGAIAWDIWEGTPIGVLPFNNAFMTLDPMVAGEYKFILFTDTSNGQPSKQDVIGTIKADPITPVTGKAIPQIIQKGSKTLAQVNDGYASYIDPASLNGGSNKNTLTFVGSTVTSLDKVGFAGWVNVKVKHSSGGEIIVPVPISVVVDYEKNGDVILAGGNDFEDYVYNVPAGETNRENYVLTKTNATAWNYVTGETLTNKILVIPNKNFTTLDPMIADSYIFHLYVEDNAGNPIKTGVIGKVKDLPNITASGQRQYCEGETISLQAELNNASTETVNWYYQPVGGTETLLTSSTKTFTKTGATNANTGFYIAKLVKDSSVKASIFVSVAPNKMYWKASASNNNWNDITNWVDANGKALNAVPASCTTVYIPDNISQYPNLKDDVTLYSTATTALTSTTEFGPAKANQVNFAENAKMQYTHKLTYSDVVVHLDGAPTKQWTMVAMPISEVYAGDNLLDDAGGRHVYFRALTDGKKYDSHTIELNQKMNLGIPYLFYVDGNISNTKMTFPSVQTNYNYMEVGPQGTTSASTASNITRSNAKFIYETTTPSISNWTTTNGSFTISYTANGNYAIVTNPFMSNLDVAKFVAANSTILENNVSTVASDCLELKEAIENNQKVHRWEMKANPTVSAKGKIAPFESFVIKLKTNTTSNIVLTYSPDMTAQD